MFRIFMNWRKRRRGWDGGDVRRRNKGRIEEAGGEGEDGVARNG